jgi:putative transposase
MSLDEKRKSITRNDPQLTVSEQCALLGLSRSSLYYQRTPETDLNKELMKKIETYYHEAPYCGVVKMTRWLCEQGYNVNRKRIRRLMDLMGLKAIYPEPSSLGSTPDKSHPKYPYLLEGVEVTRPDQVWSTDITYIRTDRGWVYLVAILDWYSRYVVDWQVSTSSDSGFCVATLKRALAKGRRPGIFNTDQGSQFTSQDFTGVLEQQGIRISMDGKGRVFDNILSERLWRSVKVEEVYLRDYRTVGEATYYLDRYFKFYNQERLHQSLGYKTPAKFYHPSMGSPVALRAPSKPMLQPQETNPPMNAGIFV